MFRGKNNTFVRDLCGSVRSVKSVCVCVRACACACACACVCVCVCVRACVFCLISLFRYLSVWERWGHSRLDLQGSADASECKSVSLLCVDGRNGRLPVVSVVHTYCFICEVCGGSLRSG